MKFSDRLDLTKAYYEWLEDCKKMGHPVEDSALNVITFLDANDFIKEEIDYGKIKEQNNSRRNRKEN